MENKETLVIKKESVITSYSIHYTKLYDEYKIIIELTEYNLFFKLEECKNK